MQSPQRRAANVKWFSTKQKPGKGRRRATPQQIVALRLRDFAILFRSRYGITLPDDDAGRDDIDPVIHHLAALKQGARKAGLWLELWAPWLTLAEQRTYISNGIATARAWTADQLAWRYGVTKQERDLLGLTTIGATDYGKGARTRGRKERDRRRHERKRREVGISPRDQYETISAEQEQPWAVEGISRRTWYRRRASAKADGTGPSTA